MSNSPGNSSDPQAADSRRLHWLPANGEARHATWTRTSRPSAGTASWSSSASSGSSAWTKGATTHPSATSAAAQVEGGTSAW